MNVAYIAGPYRAPTVEGIARNIQAAEEVAKKYWCLGYAVICPHKNTAFFDGLTDDSVWLQGDLEILSRCDICIVMKNWYLSKGATKEVEFAKEKGIPIIYDLTR